MSVSSMPRVGDYERGGVKIADQQVSAPADHERGRPRVVTVSIKGVPTLVACPEWCAVDHVGDRWNSLSDVAHFSAPVKLGAVGEADLWWSPGSGPRLLLWRDAGTNSELDLEQAEAMLAALSEKVAALRASTAGLPA